jgi:hypothetical protein
LSGGASYYGKDVHPYQPSLCWCFGERHHWINIHGGILVHMNVEMQKPKLFPGVRKVCEGDCGDGVDQVVLYNVYVAVAGLVASYCICWTGTILALCCSGVISDQCDLIWSIKQGGQGLFGGDTDVLEV